MKQIILLAGGTGLIGSNIIKRYKNQHEFHILTRNKDLIHKPGYFYWDPEKRDIDPFALKDIHSIINLSGARVNHRWTNHYKKEIIESRVNSTEFLFDQIKKNRINLEAYSSASACGYYPYDDKIKFTETSGPGSHFLSRVCIQWEAAADKFKPRSERVIKVRTGIVLSSGGGAIEEFWKLLKFHVFGIPGTGEQGTPWIHEDDLADIYMESILNKNIDGIINAVAPDYSTLNDLAYQTILIHKNIFRIKIPSTIIKLTLGEMSEMVLKGNYVTPKKLLELGYAFKYRKLAEALIAIKDRD